MDKTEFLTLVADILEVDAETVTFESSLDDIDWDSLSNISFIAEVDTKANAKVDADELAKASTVADLYSLVEASKGA
jgi:acyl carrier protein